MQAKSPPRAGSLLFTLTSKHSSPADTEIFIRKAYREKDQHRNKIIAESPATN